MCKGLSWAETVLFIISYSMTCAIVAIFNAEDGPAKGCAARRLTGSILRKAFVHTKPNLLAMLIPKPTVYMVFSIWHHHRYIGSTKDFSRRMKEHYKTALQCNPPFAGHTSWEITPQRVRRDLHRHAPT
jgi:hypothetical protein